MIKTELLKVAKPILFNTEMVRAILDGRKTQTRRVVNGGFLDEYEALTIMTLFKEKKYSEALAKWGFESLIKVGDILWVREPAKIVAIDKRHMGMSINYLAGGYKDLTIPNRFVKNDCITLNRKWLGVGKGIPNGCIKEMSRIFLKVTNVRVERLRNMCIKDMIKEGFNLLNVEDFEKNGIIQNQENITEWWINLWNKTAPKGYRWEDNPYVFVYEFERVKNA